MGELDKAVCFQINALKKRGVPAKERGDTGPWVIKEYSFEAGSKAE